jgi:hypothetical protein
MRVRLSQPGPDQKLYKNLKHKLAEFFKAMPIRIRKTFTQHLFEYGDNPDGFLITPGSVNT